MSWRPGQKEFFGTATKSIIDTHSRRFMNRKQIFLLATVHG